MPIITCLGSDNIPRLRMGVGEKPHPSYDLADWVLSVFPAKELALLQDCFDCAWKGVEKILSKEFDAAMQICNSHTPAEN